MYSLALLVLFLIPVGVLCWRVVVTKTRTQWLRVGAAGAVMATVVGVAVIYDNIMDFTFRDWRADVGLVAAMAASVYLLLWSQRKHSNRRHRTISTIAAIIGLVPIVGIVATTLLFGE